MQQDSPYRSADFWYPVLFFVVGLACCWRFNPLHAPILFDNQIYFYIAERAASGIPPHISEFDPKNALSMLITAAFIWLGRHFGTDDLMVARFLTIAAVAASFSLLWMCTRRISGSRIAAHASAIILITFTDYLSVAVAGMRPKVFLVLFMLLWLLAATRKRAFMLGAMSACCFLIWQPALLLLGISLVAMVAAGERRIGRLATTVGAAILPIALYESYFWWHGALQEQIFQSLVFPAAYPKSPPELWNTFQRLFSLVDVSVARRIVMCFFGSILVAFWVQLLMRPRLVWEWLRQRQDRLCLVLGGHATTAFCFLDYQGFPDRFFVLPFIAVADGLVVGAAIEWARDRMGSFSMRARLGRFVGTGRWEHLLTLALVLAMLLWLPARRYASGGLESQRAAAAYLGQLLEEGKTVYVMSPLHLLAMNRASNFLYYGFFPVRIRAFLAERVKKEGRLLPLKDGRLPDVVMQSRMNFVPNIVWLNRYYRKISVPVMNGEGVVVRVLREDIRIPTEAKPY